MSDDKASKLREKLFYNQKNGYDRIDESAERDMREFAEEYKAFLNLSKTERESSAFFVSAAQEKGFRKYTRGDVLIPGDRIYIENRGKGAIFAVIGHSPLSSGAHIIASHIDVPRLDIRAVPVYEDTGMCFFKTHYYGGIKKYQWTAIPLEIHGVIVKRSGEKVEVSVGADTSDPIFTITDLLPHLAQDQMKKTLAEGITGEGLNILIGSAPSKSDTEGDNRTKLAVLEKLFELYGITESDFLSAELSAVPAFPARDIGFDRSLVGAYGHDDRVCAFASASALFSMTEIPEKTCVCVLADKEEIGSEGVTGMQSQFFDTFMEDISDATGAYVRECLENSDCLSADVGNAIDPNFADVSEKRNDAKINYGAIITKFTGHRGKGDASDASAEFVSKVIRIFDGADVVWQTGELGKVDQGGGGTVAKYMANRNIETVDVGVPVLSMHAPFEVISKLDLYMANRAFFAFFQSK